jgi:hypothetical protein
LNPRIVVADASRPAADFFSQTPRMPAFEDWMNRLSDMDSGWWPFLSQRPPKDVLIDDAKLLSMSVRFGPTYGAVITAAAMGTGAVERSVAMAAVGIAWCSVVFYLSYKFTFAVYWNRRARRLQSLSSKALRP